MQERCRRRGAGRRAEPLNVFVSSGWTTVPEVQDLGVRRISVGGSLAMTSSSAVIEAARSLRNGSFDMLAGGEARSFLEAAFVFRSSEVR